MDLPYSTCPPIPNTSQVIIGHYSTGSVLDIVLHTKCSLTELYLSVKVHVTLTHPQNARDVLE